VGFGTKEPNHPGRRYNLKRASFGKSVLRGDRAYDSNQPHPSDGRAREPRGRVDRSGARVASEPD